MRMHQVEVDEEVFQFVKGHAEPLVDNFNSVLRRLLPIGTSRGRKLLKAEEVKSDKSETLPSLPVSTPQALRQILEVVYLVRFGTYSRVDATQFVAKRHGLFQQTVLDKYCRQLHLSASQFDRLLEQPDLADLKKLLKSKFPEHNDLIDQYLK